MNTPKTLVSNRPFYERIVNFIRVHDFAALGLRKRLFLSLLLLSGWCAAHNDDSLHQFYKIEDFRYLEVSSVIDLVLIPSDHEKVELITDAGFNGMLNVCKKNQTLVINWQSDKPSRKQDNKEKAGKVKAIVHFKTLFGITASGICQVNMTGIYQTDNMNIQLSGASTLNACLRNVTNLNLQLSGVTVMNLDLNEVDALKCKLSGAASLKGSWNGISQMIYNGSGSSTSKIAGKADFLNLSASGATINNWNAFYTEEFVGVVSGTSFLHLNVTENFSGEASGAAKMEVAGKPNILRSSASGVASIQIN